MSHTTPLPNHRHQRRSSNRCQMKRAMCRVAARLRLKPIYRHPIPHPTTAVHPNRRWMCRLERNLTSMSCATAARHPRNRHWTPQYGATAAAAIPSTGPQADKYNHPAAAFTPAR
ncbi:hypothetical protein B0H13DRAFT_2322661 [Mycena leptocephala]|nr:hypothetical protein B0H13DRAFT_2322661 [Mycena leptocephala]